VSNIIFMFSGVLIVMTGFILAGAGIALGVQAALPTVPPWVFFLVIGVVALAVGLGLLYWGKTRTVESVENTLTMKDKFKSSPFLMVGAVLGVGLLAGIIVRRIRASHAESDKAKAQVAAFTDAQVEEVLQKQTPWWQRKFKQFAFSAAASAFAVAFRTYGVPLLQQALERFSGKPEQAGVSHNGETSPEHQRYDRFNSVRQ
jgi:hypothetical protein